LTWHSGVKTRSMSGSDGTGTPAFTSLDGLTFRAEN
jgi:hypothetical protein